MILSLAKVFIVVFSEPISYSFKHIATSIPYLILIFHILPCSLLKLLA